MAKMIEKIVGSGGSELKISAELITGLAPSDGTGISIVEDGATEMPDFGTDHITLVVKEIEAPSA